MHIPFERLPTNLQEEIMGYLQADNFQAAKRLRDQYEEYLRQVQQKKFASNQVRIKIPVSQSYSSTQRLE